MSSIPDAKTRAPLCQGSASEGSAEEARLPRQRSFSSPLFDGLPEFRDSTPVTASDSKDAPRTRKKKSQRVEAPLRKRVRTDASAATATTSAQHHPLSAALRVVLAADWIPVKSVKVLQLSSLSVCKDCREATGFHVRVVTRTPRRLWTGAPARQGGSRSRRRSWGHSGVERRVPPLRAEELTFRERPGRRAAAPLGKVVLPPSLNSITFGEGFNESVRGVRFPPTLSRIRFNGRFNQSLVGVAFPASLRSVTFCCRFNQALDGVSWNSGLEGIVFRPESDFNKPLTGVVWPGGLRVLSLGGDFDQPVEGVAWPEGLGVLLFGRAFDQPVAGVRWPSSLKQLYFGCRFRQSMEDVRLPRGLEILDMGDGWNDSLAALRLPDGLVALHLGRAFDQPIHQVRFPPGLSVLSFGDSFNQPLREVRFPPDLEVLQFGDSFNQPFDGVTWPPALKEAFFGSSTDEHEVVEADWPCASLKEMVVGGRRHVVDGKWLIDKFC